MKFLKNWTINLDILQDIKYVDLSVEFQEQVDMPLANMLLDFKGTDTLGCPIIADESREEFRKLVQRVNGKTNMLRFKLNGRLGNLGRRYADVPKPYKFKGKWVYSDTQTPDANGEIPMPNADFAKYYSALIAMPKVIKNTLFVYQGWIDIDQKKGHTTILSELLTRNKEDASVFEKCITDFDAICGELIPYHSVDDERPLTKGDIKLLFNKTIYGGGFKTWVEDIQTGKRKDMNGVIIEIVKGKEIMNTTKPHPLYVAFYTKAQEIIGIVYTNNTALQAKVCKDLVLPEVGCFEGFEDPEDKKLYENVLWRRKNRVMSYFCGIIENEITFRAYKYMYENKVCDKSCIDWGYDGFTIPPVREDIDFNYHFEKMNEYVRKQTGFNKVTFAVKIPENKPNEPIEFIQELIDQRRELAIAQPVIEAVVVGEVVEAQADENIYVSAEIENDAEGISLVFPKIKRILKYYDGQYFLKIGRIWLNNKEKIDACIMNYFMKCDLFMTTEKGAIKSYSKNVTGAKHLREALYSKISQDNVDEELYNKFHSTTQNRLCFRDGILDFKLKRFITWEQVDAENIEYFSPVMINRDFGKYFLSPNQENIQKVEDEVFKNLFGDDCKKALGFLSRGVAGCWEDKNWGSYIGNRNCGKGVFEILNFNAIGSYYTTIQSGNLLVKRNSSGDIEKEFYWGLDLQFARLAVSQELPLNTKENPVKLNGEIFKRLCSGGDNQKARKLFQNPVNFRIQSRVMLMCNDMPPISSNDCMETCFEFNSSIQFKPAEEIEILKAKGINELILRNYKIADPQIKDKCRTEDWANAYIMLLYQNYTDKTILNIKPAVECDSDDEDDDEDDEANSIGLKNWLLGLIDVMPKDKKKKDKDWFMTNQALDDLFYHTDYAEVSKKKRSIELTSLGFINGKNQGIRGWYGVKLKPPPVPVGVDEEAV